MHWPEMFEAAQVWSRHLKSMLRLGQDACLRMPKGGLGLDMPQPAPGPATPIVSKWTREEKFS